MNLQGRKVLGATVFYSLGEIIPRVLAFFLLPILTRYLSTSEYGINSYINAVMAFVYVIASLSLNSYVLRHFFLEPDEREKKKLVGDIFLIICTFNVVLLGLQILIIPHLLSAFNVKIPFYPYFFLGIINNFFDVISIIPLVLYRVKGNTKAFFNLSVSRIIFQYAATYVFVVMLHLGLLGTFYARLLINIPFGIIYYLIISRYAPIKFNFKRLKDALTFSLPLIPGGLSYLIITISDRIILERFVGLNEIGIYSVAVTISIALNVVIQALYKTIEPILFKAYATDDFASLSARLYKYYLLFVYIGGFGIAIISKEVFRFMGSKAFQAGYVIVPGMVLSVILSGVNLYLNTILIAEKRQKIISISIIISATVSIALNFILIPHYGYYGAIVAAFSASIAGNIISQYYARVKGKLIIQQVLLLAIVLGVPLLFDLFSNFNNLAVILLIKALLVMTFSGLTFVLLRCNPKKDWNFQLFPKKAV